MSKSASVRKLFYCSRSRSMRKFNRLERTRKKEKEYKRYNRDGPNRIRNPQLVREAVSIVSTFLEERRYSLSELQRRLNKYLGTPPAHKFILQKIPNQQYPLLRDISHQSPESYEEEDIQTRNVELPPYTTIGDFAYKKYGRELLGRLDSNMTKFEEGIYAKLIETRGVHGALETRLFS